jgi:hypothetical protein
MLAAFRRLATIDRTSSRELLAKSMLRYYMQSDKSFDIATCMYYTGIDPFTKEAVYVARNLRDRKLQRALMQFFKPENWFTVREALLQAGRQDLIGSGCDCLIPANPRNEALAARRERADRALSGDHVHTVPNAVKGRGYRPKRQSARRRDRA